MIDLYWTVAGMLVAMAVLRQVVARPQRAVVVASAAFARQRRTMPTDLS
jgi:hypothetical protein